MYVIVCVSVGHLVHILQYGALFPNIWGSFFGCGALIARVLGSFSPCVGLFSNLVENIVSVCHMCV